MAGSPASQKFSPSCSASCDSGSSPRRACAWARIQYWHLLVADTTAATISRSARGTSDSSNIPEPTWAIRVFMMLGLRLLTAWTLEMRPAS